MVFGIGLAAAGGSVTGAAGSILGAVGGVLGSFLDQNLIMPLLIKQPGQGAKGIDIDLSLAAEGTPGTYVWGRFARVPMHLVWTSQPWDETSGLKIGKRQEVPVATWYAHLQWLVALHTLAGASDPSQGVQQIIFDGRRVYLRDTIVSDVTATARANPATEAGVWVRFSNWTNPGPNVWRQLIVRNAKDSSGDPITGSPDMSGYDVGGTAAVKIGTEWANGTTDTPLYMEVLASRVIDAKGNTELILRIPSALVMPSSWVAASSSAGTFAQDRIVTAGTAIVVKGELVGVDPKVFGGTLDFQRGDTKPPVLTSVLGGSQVPYLHEWEQVVAERLNLSGVGSRIPQAQAVVEGLVTSLPTVVHAILGDFTDLDTDDVDVDELDSLDLVQGLKAFGPFVAEEPLTTLAVVHDLIWQEGRGSNRGAPARVRYGVDRDVVDLETWQVNVVPFGREFDENDITSRRVEARERPRRVEVTFSDVDNLFQRGEEPARADWDSTGREVRVDLEAYTMDRDRAFGIARRLLREGWDRLRAVEFTSFVHGALVQEDDIVRVTDREGEQWLVLVDEVHEADFAVEIKGYSITSATLEAPASTGAGALGDRQGDIGEPRSAPAHAPLLTQALELLPIRDEDAGRPGFYVAAAPADPTVRFGGAAVFVQRAGTDRWDYVVPIMRAATIGEMTDVLADGSAGAYDETNDCNVALLSGSLEGMTEAEVDAARNLALIGDEVVGFVDVAGEADDSFTLSHLSRARLLTDDATDGHVAGERFVLLDDAIVFVPLNAEDIGTTIQVKVVPVGATLGSIEAQELTIAGRTVKPLPLAEVALTDNGDDTLTTSWAYQSLRTVRYRNPSTAPVAPGDRIVVRYYNDVLSGPIPTLLDERPKDGDATEDVLEDPAGVQGLTGPNVSVIAFVQSAEWGAGPSASDTVSATLSPTGALAVPLDTLDAGGASDGDVLTYDSGSGTWGPAAPA